MYVHFLVGNELNRGIFIYSIKDANKEDWYEITYNHQPLKKHPQVIKRIILNKQINKIKKILVELRSDTLVDYYDGQLKRFRFKNVLLTSSEEHQLKLAQSIANKKIGQIKRKRTLELKASMSDSTNEIERLKQIQKSIQDKADELVQTFVASLPASATPSRTGP